MRNERDDRSELSDALQAVDLDRVEALLAAGAYDRFRPRFGSDLLQDAVRYPDVRDSPRFLEMLALLVRFGVPLSMVTAEGDSAIRFLSQFGRFDGLAYLLKAGADRALLDLPPLHAAVALGSLADVDALIRGGADLELRDEFGRTPWLIAAHVGDLAKAEALANAGADTSARGNYVRPALLYAMERGHLPMVRWLIDRGADVNQTDDCETTALCKAIERESFECVEMLLAAGADPNLGMNNFAIAQCHDTRMIRRLIEAGADSSFVNRTLRRTLSHLPTIETEIPDQDWSGAFASSCSPCFGKRNPERMNVPFWEAMIRNELPASYARTRFETAGIAIKGPVWCANRTGQSFTVLPDGRTIRIGGRTIVNAERPWCEHPADLADPDFCIYNDVFVHQPDGSFAIFGYPEAVFPPTDSHSATLIGDHIYVVGRLGYPKGRQADATPVFRLNVHDLRIEQIETHGEAPGWIYGQRAQRIGKCELRIRGGTAIRRFKSGGEIYSPGTPPHVLNLDTLQWRREPRAGGVA